jgi:hypothetical protein
MTSPPSPVFGGEIEPPVLAGELGPGVVHDGTFWSTGVVKGVPGVWSQVIRKPDISAPPLLMSPA